MTLDRDNIISHTEALERSSLSLFGCLCPGGFAVGVNFVNRHPEWVQMFYPMEWQRYYVEHGLIETDPTIEHAQTNFGHITWAALKILYPKARVFVDGPQFGITNGNTISIVRRGCVSIASGAGPEWSADEVSIASAALSALADLHTKTRPETPPDHIRQVVRLMCDGLRDAEIAERLGIKIETVRQRRDRAYKMSNTTTPAQLAAFATRAGWTDRNF